MKAQGKSVCKACNLEHIALCRIFAGEILKKTIVTNEYIFRLHGIVPVAENPSL